MLIQTLFKSLTSTPTRRRPIRRSPPASRLCLEALEDRFLLSFNPAVSYPVGLAPQAVTVADFNRDGRLDLALANYSSSNVSILLGNADGSFQPAQNSATGAGPLSLAVGDFDADGKLDLASANASNVSVLLGNGNGTFQTPSNIDIGSSPRSVAVGDFNGDLKQDFVAANYDYGKVSVLLGTGSGTLGAPTDGNVGYYPRSVAAGDMNGDGKLDLVTANQSGGNVSVLLGNGLGGIAAGQNYAAGSQPGSVAMADFNGDGHIDLVTANGDTGTVSVLLGTGAGSGSGAFKPPLNAATAAGPLGVAVGDFNGDGRPDAASASSNSNNVSTLLNDGTWPALDAPSISIGDAAAVTEGNTGTASASFTVSLSAAYGQAISVQYATADRSATLAGGDYQAKTDTLTFGVGETSKTVTVLVNGDRVVESIESFYLRLGDRVVEPDEYFSVNLSSSTNGTIDSGHAEGVIVDDEPRVSIGSATVLEGNTGTTAMTFTVTLSAASDAPVTVTYATADGSATIAGGDYQAKIDTLTFAPGETSKTIPVLVNGDRLGEYDEYFYVNLTGAAGALITSGTGYGTILDNEPRLSINSVSLKEGNSGTKVKTFTMTLSAAYDQAVTVNFATQDGSARVAGNDYVAKSGSLTFAAGQTTKSITVVIKGDTKKEADEYFYVLLSGASGNAIISNAYGWGTILNDDGHISRRNKS